MNKKELLLGKVLGPILILISIFFLFAAGMTTVDRRDQRQMKEIVKEVKSYAKTYDSSYYEDLMEDYLDDAGIHEDVDDFLDDVKDGVEIFEDGSISAKELAFNTGILKKLYKVLDVINDDSDYDLYDKPLEALEKIILATRIAKLLFFLTIIAAVYAIVMMYCGRRMAAIAPVVTNAIWFIAWIVMVVKMNDESRIDFRITAGAVLPLIISIAALILGIMFNTTEGPVSVDQLKDSFSGAAAAAGTAAAAASAAATNAAANISAQYQQAQQQYQAQQQAQQQAQAQAPVQPQPAPQAQAPAGQAGAKPCFCSKCGTKYEPGSKFCGGCGNPLS